MPRLTEQEQQEIIRFLEADKPLPEKYRFLLFENKRQVELVWNGKTNQVTNIVLPFQVIEHEFVCQRFEMHTDTSETLLPLTGGMIVASIPAGEIDIEQLHAFYVPVGMGVCWKPRTWHYAPYPIGGDATCAIIFRHGTGGDDMHFADLPEPVGFAF